MFYISFALSIFKLFDKLHKIALKGLSCTKEGKEFVSKEAGYATKKRN